MPSARITCNFTVPTKSETGAQTEPGGEQFSEPDRRQRTYQDFDSQAYAAAFILKPSV